MNKKIIVSLSVIGAVAVIAIGGTIAYFSDTETSSGNTFVAGAFDLKVDSTCHYDGMVCQNNIWAEETTGSSKYRELLGQSCSCSWALDDLGNKLFFNFGDIKPGDFGEDTVSLHIENDAWVCAEIANLASNDNGCNNPETKAGDATCGNGQGELQNNLYFTIWKDNGLDTESCNNKLDAGEQVLVNNQPASSGLWPIADSQHGPALPGDKTYCLGIAWSVPSETGNMIQSDSLAGDVIFSAYQARNQGNFVCVQGGGCVPTTEICGNDIDEDCNGSDLACPPVQTCGNGTIQPLTESCDDGNTVGGDGCSATCSVEYGYNCNGSPSTCVTICGDGRVAGSEACDDEDANSGDGCSNVCQIESGWQCSGEPSACEEIQATEICGNGLDDEGDGWIDCADYDCFTSPSCLAGHLVINEVDYDQPSNDNTEFIEIKNISSSPINLGDYSIRLMNGGVNPAAEYKRIDLPDITLAAGNYYVVCGNSASTSNCDLDVSVLNTDLIQNGSPDAIALYNDATDVIIDTLSYEGDVSGYTEGTGVITGDNTAAWMGLSRWPDGVDTNNNNTDFSLRCISPGNANSSSVGCDN
jgi:predicted ribosomally synthesized peptide with SipW-like signal peptide